MDLTGCVSLNLVSAPHCAQSTALKAPRRAGDESGQRKMLQNDDYDQWVSRDPIVWGAAVVGFILAGFLVGAAVIAVFGHF